MEPLSDERLTRNWSELLQELRVTQTGAQILTGFLLTVPFSSRFEVLDATQRVVYLVVLSGSVLTTLFMVAPVAFHRVLFRHHRRQWIVQASNVCARISLVLFALTSAGILFLVFDVVTSLLSAIIALIVALTVVVVLWIVVPRLADRQADNSSAS